MAHVKESLSELAYSHIKRMILNLELKPGDSIPEDKISGILSCSRTPIREAIYKLSNEGLVQHTPQKGARVPIFSESEIQQIGVMRLSQEIMGARLAIHYGSLAGYLSLEPLIEKCEHANKRKNLRDRVQADMEFHMRIIEIGENELLMKYHKNLWYQICIIQYQLADSIGFERTTTQITQHRALVNAIITHDIGNACESITCHLKDFYGLDNSFVSQFES